MTEIMLMRRETLAQTNKQILLAAIFPMISSCFDHSFNGKTNESNDHNIGTGFKS